MKTCVVVSNAFSFLQAVEQGLRLVLEPYGIREAVSYRQAEEYLSAGPVQAVFVDEASMPEPPEQFFAAGSRDFPDTWFVSVGETSYPDVMHLSLPFDDQTLGFFIQNEPTPENRQLGLGFRSFMGDIYPILLSHLWTGILNRWVLSDHTMIMMAARRMRLQGLENTHILPVLAKTVHKDKLDTSRDQATKDHLFFQELLTEYVLKDQNAGATLDRFAQKWAVICYSDMYPVSPAELYRRCVEAVAAAEARQWQISFYIGHPCLPEKLLDQWTLLEERSEEDAGFHSQVVQLESRHPREIASLPDMQLWRRLLEQGKCVEAQGRISEFILELAQSDKLDVQWLIQFRDDFLREIYQVIQTHGMPVEKILTDYLEGDTFRRSAASVRQLHGWVAQIIQNIAEFLESESADTIVKKTQKYILQNLDQSLSRDDIAAHVFVSSGYLGRVFKKELNMSLSEYIYNERMKLAATMLEQSDLYVTSIALNVGFSNFPYFSTQFKKFSGLTPVEYRKRFRSGAEL